MTDTSTTTRAKRTNEPKPPRRGKSSAVSSGPRRKPKKSFWQIEITPEKIKLVEVMNFARQCSSFVRAGIPLYDALSVISEDAPSKKLKEVLLDVGDRIRGGASFTEALNAHRRALPPYFVSMVRSAELTGRLDEVLDQLAEYIDRDLQTRQKIKSALTYPVVVMFMAIGTVFVLATFVLPKFKVMFDSLDATLPVATRALLRCIDLMSAWGLPFLLATFVLLLLGFLYARTDSGRYRRDSLLLRLPGVGTLVRYAIIERFCRTMAAMVQSGVPLPDALAVATDSTKNAVYRKAMAAVREEMVRGGGLAQPLAATKLFPAGARQMIRVGEATGTLDQQLGSTAVYFERELQYRLKRFTDLFEPAIILTIGAVVAFVAIALVSAMYGIYRQVEI